MTIIRRFSLPAAFEGGPILDLESRLVLPGSPYAYFRFRNDLQNSIKNLINDGPAGAMSNTGGTTFDAVSATTAEGNGLFCNQVHTLPCSFVSVFAQTAAGANQTLAGNPRAAGSATYAGLYVSTGANLAASYRTGSVNYAATLAKSGGDRAEMIVGAFDSVAQTITLWRPRTADKIVVGSVPLSTQPEGTITRILGAGSTITEDNSVKGYMTLAWNGLVLSDLQVEDIYNQAKVSLAVSGVSI